MGGQAAGTALENTNSMFQIGLLCVGSASMLSGLSATLTQRAITGSNQRNTLVLSAEMAVYGIVFLLLNLAFNSDIKAGAGAGLFSNWDLQTLIPVLSNVSDGSGVPGYCKHVHVYDRLSAGWWWAS
jgi:hypothetical protein